MTMMDHDDASDENRQENKTKKSRDEKDGSTKDRKKNKSKDDPTVETDDGPKKSLTDEGKTSKKKDKKRQQSEEAAGDNAVDALERSKKDSPSSFKKKDKDTSSSSSSNNNPPDISRQESAGSEDGDTFDMDLVMEDAAKKTLKKGKKKSKKGVDDDDESIASVATLVSGNKSSKRGGENSDKDSTTKSKKGQKKNGTEEDDPDFSIHQKPSRGSSEWVIAEEEENDVVDEEPSVKTTPTRPKRRSSRDLAEEEDDQEQHNKPTKLKRKTSKDLTEEVDADTRDPTETTSGSKTPRPKRRTSKELTTEEEDKSTTDSDNKNKTKSRPLNEEDGPARDEKKKSKKSSAKDGYASSDDEGGGNNNNRKESKRARSRLKSRDGYASSDDEGDNNNNRESSKAAKTRRRANSVSADDDDGVNRTRRKGKAKRRASKDGYASNSDDEGDMLDEVFGDEPPPLETKLKRRSSRDEQQLEDDGKAEGRESSRGKSKKRNNDDVPAETDTKTQSKSKPKQKSSNDNEENDSPPSATNDSENKAEGRGLVKSKSRRKSKLMEDDEHGLADSETSGKTEMPRDLSRSMSKRRNSSVSEDGGKDERESDRTKDLIKSPSSRRKNKKTDAAGIDASLPGKGEMEREDSDLIADKPLSSKESKSKPGSNQDETYDNAPTKEVRRSKSVSKQRHRSYASLDVDGKGKPDGRRSVSRARSRMRSRGSEDADGSGRGKVKRRHSEGWGSGQGRTLSPNPKRAISRSRHRDKGTITGSFSEESVHKRSSKSSTRGGSDLKAHSEHLRMSKGLDPSADLAAQSEHVRSNQYGESYPSMQAGPITPQAEKGKLGVEGSKSPKKGSTDSSKLPVSPTRQKETKKNVSGQEMPTPPTKSKPINGKKAPPMDPETLTKQASVLMNKETKTKEGRIAERQLIKRNPDLMKELIRLEEEKAQKKAAKTGNHGGFTLQIPTAAAPKSVKVKTQSKNKSWKRYETITLDCLQDDYIIRETTRSKFGGRKDRVDEATGFFYVKRIEGRWTFVDPDGNLYYSAGLNATGPYKDDKKFQKAFAEKYESTAHWAKESHDYLFNKLGFNTIGAWSDPHAFTDSGFHVPYCPYWTFMQTYAKKRIHGAVKLGENPMPIFDPEFEEFCDEYAKALAEKSNDRWILGHFSDNELPLKENDIISRYLALPSKDPGHMFAVKWLTERKKMFDFDEEDNADFCSEIITRYYRIVSKAIKKYDPNHLYLGTRFHGFVARQSCTFVACAPYVDVISVNYYHQWTPEQDWLNRWSASSDRPVLISEWYAKGEDAEGCDNSTGAGFIVPTQKDRAAFYENFTLALLRNPNVVGWHWFRYLDKGGNMGILNSSYEPYAPLVAAMQRINTKIYSLSDFLLTDSPAVFSDHPTAAD